MQRQQLVVDEVGQAASRISMYSNIKVGPFFRVIEKGFSRVRLTSVGRDNADAGLVPGHLTYPLQHKAPKALHPLHCALLALAALILDRTKQVMPNGCGNVS